MLQEIFKNEQGFSKEHMQDIDELRNQVVISFSFDSFEWRSLIDIFPPSKDPQSDNLLLSDGAKIVGTIRCWIPASGSLWCKLGLAIQKEYRRQGVGQFLVRAMEEFLEERRGLSGREFKDLERCQIILYGQTRVETFYLKCGYERDGDVFDIVSSFRLSRRGLSSPRIPFRTDNLT